MLRSVMGLLRTGLPKFALPLLSGTAFLALSSASALAQAPGPLASKRAPGHVTEVVAPVATVVSTVHYQAELTLSCSGSCVGDFPRPGAKRRLNITRMSCVISGTTSSATFLVGFIELRAADNSHVLFQYLPVDHSANGIHMLNRAVDVQVGSRQHIHVLLTLSTPGTATCTATGTLDTLE